MHRRSGAIGGVLLLAIAVGVMFGPTFGTTQTQDPRETVSVSSSASVSVPPEIARISLNIRIDADTPSQVADLLANRANAVVDALKGAGFSDDDLTIRSVRVTPRRNKDRDIVGYRGRTTIAVETENLDGIGDVIDLGLRAGATGIGGVSFSLKDNSDAIEQALRRAMRFAIAKAGALATESGRDLGRALVIEEGGSTQPTTQVLASVLGVAGGDGGGGGASSFPVLPPDITVRARIAVTFALQ